MWVWSLGWEHPREEGMATHSSILAWRVPWTEGPGGLQSLGLQRVGHDWSDWGHKCGRWLGWSRSAEDISSVAGSPVHHHFSLPSISVRRCCFRNVSWSPESGRGPPCLLRVLFVDCGRFDGKNELDWLTLICRIRLGRIPQEGLSRGVMTKATKP